jgi:tetratricopeptide (TPR) repeat protein
MTEKATATAMVTSTPTPTATTTPAPTPTPTSTRLPTAAQIDGLENVPQKFNNCGPSNLSIALSFFGYEAHQLDIAAILRPNYDDRNVSPGELIRYVNERTPLRASVYSGGDLNTLKRLIAAGIPVTIEKGLIPNERDGWMGHYLTLFAYDDAVQEFYSMDTYLGPWDGSGRAESYETVQRYWGHFNYTFFVVFTGEMQARVEEALGPTLLDPMAMWQAAGLKANVEIQSEDENAFAWFNLGTSLTQLGQLTGQQVYFNNAVVAYDRAREIGLPPRMLWYQFEPYIAYLEAGRIDDVLDLTSATMIGGGWDVEETHLYRGHALRAKGDEAGARAAYRQALQINPNFQAAQEALE